MQNDTYNRGGFYAFLFSMVFSLGFFVYVTFVHPGIDLKEIKTPEPGTETSLADGGKAAPDISKIDKPWEENDAMLAHGEKVYSQNCAVCHGAKGEGDGPGGKGLVPPPRNFVKGDWKKGGNSIGLMEVLQNGLPPSAMVSFKALPIKDRWAVIQYIRSITHNKTPDDSVKLAAFAKTAD